MWALIKRVHSPLLWEHYGCGTCRFESIISLRLLLLLHTQLVRIDRTLLLLFNLWLDFLLKILTTRTWTPRSLKWVEWLMLRKCSAFPISFFIRCFMLAQDSNSSPLRDGNGINIVNSTCETFFKWLQGKWPLNALSNYRVETHYSRRKQVDRFIHDCRRSVGSVVR